MLGVRRAGTVRPMLPLFPPAGESLSDVQYAAAQLFSAAEIMADVETSLPGPETRAGFSGAIRVAFDAFVAMKTAAVVEAKNSLASAALSCRGLADSIEDGEVGAGR